MKCSTANKLSNQVGRRRIATVAFGIVAFAAIAAFADAPPSAVPGREMSAPHAIGPVKIDPSLLGAGGQDPGCISCHGDIENVTEVMGFWLNCTFCHGGDPDAFEKELAHVKPTLPVINDNTVPPLDYDLAYQRFVNPTNLRVVWDTCGNCHVTESEEIVKSMMATAAGHYAGGLYQNGVVDTQTPIYGTFAVVDEDGIVPTEDGAVESLLDLITYDPQGDPDLVATHFAAVPAQACARCHLWSRGKGYRGAVGADGVYRADGCAACHMLYANDGLSQSADMAINHSEPGHPMHHTVTKAIPAEQCLHCHHRGARIGLSFTGRAQMPPGLPSGPGIPGTTDEIFNGNYHYSVDDTNPPDIHRELGMDCIDCHTKAGVMGDSNLWGHMDQATKIECQTCHGTPTEQGGLIDNDGNPLVNVEQIPEGVMLTSKVSGAMHPVLQVMDIVDPKSNAFNPRASCSMDGNHIKDQGGLTCYACHAYWTPNCFGCHFERDERFTGINLVTRQEEIGRVRTNNKVFESFKHFFLGPNSDGRIAPYIVSCHPIADVTDPDGEKILDFVMPSTVNNKSGLGHNPVNPHTTRSVGEVRSCAECHRAPPALGLGSGNYALARDYAYAATDNGVRVYDRRTDPADPSLVGTLPVAAPLAIALQPDVVHGIANYLYVAAGEQGVSLFDMSGEFPIPATQLIDNINAIDVARVARYLYVVVQGVGVHVYDNQDPETATLVGIAPIPTAVRAVPWGLHLFVAAGDAGLVVVNISDHDAPVITGSLPGINAVDVTLYAHFQADRHFAARAYVADPDFGVRIVDLLPEFSAPVVIAGIALPGAQGLDTYARYVLADDLNPSREHDYLYVAAGNNGLHIFDITDPDGVFAAAALTDIGGSAIDVDVVSEMTPPGTDDYALVANSEIGVQLIDVTDPQAPTLLDTEAAAGTSRVFVEVQQMDRFIDEQGNQLKENSHPDVAVMTRADLVRLLSADIATECLLANDFDGDWDVDGNDFAHYVACVTGPGGVVTQGCGPADADRDGDVDFGDYAALQLVFTGR